VLYGYTLCNLQRAPRADELNSLPQAPPAATPIVPSVAPTPNATVSAETNASAVISIKSVIPGYVDQGVTMVPMRPLCDFLGAKIAYHDSIITVSRDAAPLNSQNRKPSFITLRAGGETAQMQDGNGLKTVRLPLPADERLGTTFLPARFFAEAFDAEITMGAGQTIIIKSGDRTGVLQTNTTAQYQGRDAARVTIVNHVGRALSIRLTGPQNIAIELGRKQSVSHLLRPGVYYYRAASTGMKTVKGARRLMAGRKAPWSWGRR